MTTFTELGVPAALDTALTGLGITTPFPIQTATLPDTLAGRDVLGRGRTGSGKTYAFVIPVVARLAASARQPRAGRPRALILAPTRELATQIEATLRPLADAAGLRTLVVFGGVGANPQIKALKAGVDVLVACPGRLDDHIRNGHASLDDVEITVLDEADHMADLGFLPVVRRLLSQTPPGGQRLLFSATLDNGVDVLVQRFMRKPVTHAVDAAAQAPVEMDHHVLHVQHDDRFGVLVELLAAPGRSVVFTRTKRRAKVLTRQLNAAGVPAVELHGNLAQNARNRNLSAFSDGTAGTLVATDIAARGIHVDDVTLVVHADPPVEHKAYLHRSGRTARAGARGTVITLMTDDQQADVRDLARKAGIRPVTHRTRPGDGLLAELAPGERTFLSPASITAALAQSAAVSAPVPAAADTEDEAAGGRGRRRRGGRGRRPATAAGGRPASGAASGGRPASGAATGGRSSAGAAAGGRSSSGGVASGRSSSGAAAGGRAAGGSESAGGRGGEAGGSAQGRGPRRASRSEPATQDGGKARSGQARNSGQSHGAGQGRGAAGAGANPARGTSASRGSGQARGSAPRSGTPQQRPASTTSSGGAAAFSARSNPRRGR